MQNHNQNQNQTQNQTSSGPIERYTNLDSFEDKIEKETQQEANTKGEFETVFETQTDTNILQNNDQKTKRVLPIVVFVLVLVLISPIIGLSIYGVLLNKSMLSDSNLSNEVSLNNYSNSSNNSISSNFSSVSSANFSQNSSANLFGKPSTNPSTNQPSNSSQDILGGGVSQYLLPGFEYQKSVLYLAIELGRVEIADTPTERSQGLMNRQEIDDNFAMLFVFEDEAIRQFWMQSTPSSLDIIYFDSQGKVVSISKNTKPLQILEQYPSKFPARYVMEVKAGGAQKLGIIENNYYNLPLTTNNAVPFDWSYDK